MHLSVLGLWTSVDWELDHSLSGSVLVKALLVPIFLEKPRGAFGRTCAG
jgi:hypothetical protein